MYMLGCLYRDGRGVEKNRVTSHMWFNIAASHESYPARRGKAVEARVELEADMASEETIEAQRLAREWDEAHPR